MSRLDHETITLMALQIIDREGLDALSMRRLGRELNADPKAVYYYYENKDALISGVLRTAFDEMDLPEQLTGAWQIKMRQISIAYFDLVSQHPNLLPYFMTFDGSVPIVFEIVERIVVALEDTGLSARSIAQIVDLFSSFVPYFALSAQRNSGTTEEAYRQIMNLPDNAFPYTKAMMQQLELDDLDGDLEFQIDIILMGIKELIELESPT